MAKQKNYSKLWGFICLIGIFFLSLLDGVSSFYGVQEGEMKELNPIMNATMRLGGMWFIFIKQVIIAGALAFAAINWHQTAIRHVGSFLLGFYSLIGLLHLYAIFYIF